MSSLAQRVGHGDDVLPAMYRLWFKDLSTQWDRRQPGVSLGWVNDQFVRKVSELGGRRGDRRRNASALGAASVLSYSSKPSCSATFVSYFGGALWVTFESGVRG